MHADIILPDACETIALAGGPYSNFAAVKAFLAATAAIPYRFCLGDIGGFGPHPDRTRDLIRGSGMACLQGNYDHAVGFDERDCGCGYLDGTPRVGYALLRFPRGAAAPAPELVPLDYDPTPVAAAMRAEGLPDAFPESLERGVWTTCAAIMPSAERVVAERYAASAVT